MNTRKIHQNSSTHLFAQATLTFSIWLIEGNLEATKYKYTKLNFYGSALSR